MTYRGPGLDMSRVLSDGTGRGCNGHHVIVALATSDKF